MTNLERYVVTYKLDGSDTELADIRHYYENCIKPLGAQYSYRSLYGSRTVICPLHDDNDPSLGIIGKQGIKRYHCFGCGASGTIVRLHQRIQKKFYDKSLTDEESAIEIANMYGISIRHIELEEEELDYYAKTMKTMYIHRDAYTSKDYELELRDARLRSKTPDQLKRLISVANTKYIATIKELYDNV